MSGGSWDYFYQELERVAHRLRREGETPERIAFSDHLLLCAKALHDIEWVDSHDYGPGGEAESIMQVINKEDVMNVASIVLREAIETAQGVLERCKK